MGLHSISLFSGVGMLDEGLRAGLAYLGVTHRTVCHVEREAHGAAVLAARMEEGSMDAAPVWSDVCTFDAAAWRGRVDCVVAGFPCQDLSVAGRRAGLDGKRSGLFFEVTRIAADCGAWLLFLENVAGIATATASVVDAEEGALEERAAARVVGELADLGWNAEWVTLSASDVGASHGRARWFCLAWRVDDAGGLRADEGIHAAHPGRRHVRRHEPEPVCGRSNQAGDHAGCATVADTGAAGRGCAARCDQPGQRCLEEQGQPRRGECGGDAVGRFEVVGGALANPECGSDRGQEPAAHHRQPQGDRPADRTGRHRSAPLFAPGPPIQHGPEFSPNTPNSPRHLNPLFGAWLMGWPSTWVIAEPHASSALATASWRFALQQRLSSLLNAPASQAEAA
jgi:DNA (cytosine-5)-methyltransferase 1